MELKARQKENVVILDLVGRIDVDAANLIEAVGECVRKGFVDILCNLEEVELIDYMGLSVIVIAYKEIVNHKGRLKFVNVPVHLRNILAVAGMDKTIESYFTEELAMDAFKEDKVIEDIQKMQLRRRFKRLPIDIKVELKSKDTPRPLCIQADVLNLSAIGAYIYGCDKFKLGDEVIFTMKLPPFNEGIVIESRVVWLSDKQVQPHNHPGMGIEFSHISEALQQKLLEYIERNLSSLSQE
ncbi:MAG: PilZ domain-containing protein [Candidatus Omnitrophica bacterium]|nr:PilZ domain-containing protein [Candidatus Omnitrophota bacterium]